MSRTCLAAWTAVSGSYPPYVNFSRDGDEAVIAVRPNPDAEGNVGKNVEVRLPLGEFWMLWREAMRSLADQPDVVKV